MGELAWPANYEWSFRMPRACRLKDRTDCHQRASRPRAGETITSPSVHLGCIHGDFDEAVQAMHTQIARCRAAIQTGPTESST